MVPRPSASDLAHLQAMHKLPTRERKQVEKSIRTVTSGPSPKLPAPNGVRRRRRSK